jgi:hypothetical protein
MDIVASDPELSFIDNFQAKIDRLGCPAIVQRASGALPADTIELFDGDGRFITLLPTSVSPDTAVLGFGLYQLGLRAGQGQAALAA